MKNDVIYVCGGVSLAKLFQRALKPFGYGEVVYFPEFWRALEALGNGSYSLIVLQAPLPWISVDDDLVSSLRSASNAPVVLLGFPPDHPAGQLDNFWLVPPPVTAAGLASAVEALHQPSEESILLSRLLSAPGFDTFSEPALVHLLGGATTRKLSDGDELFAEGSEGGGMYFVLAGGIALRLGGRELETVGPGGLFGEMALIETSPRAAQAVAAGETLLLEVEKDALDAADQEFKAIFFELATRQLIRRLRQTNLKLRFG